MTNNEIVERINRVLAAEFEVDPDVMRPSALGRNSCACTCPHLD